MDRVAFRLLFVFVQIYVRRILCVPNQASELKGGKTPGVRTPGDPSYFSELCIKPVNTRVIRPLLNEASLVRRKLLTQKKRKRPPAWTSPHLNERDIAQVDDAISFFSSNDNYCPFYTKNCVRPGVTYLRPSKPGKALEGKSTNKIQMSLQALKNLPSIKKGTWGSCALVGLADTLLRKKRGEEIDSHDTVIRLGELPLGGGYREFVGSKTDVTWVRRKSNGS